MAPIYSIMACAGVATASAFTPAGLPATRGATGLHAHVTTESQRIMAEARTVMPGGVSSPVRAFSSVGGEPIVFESVNGAYANDVDGNKCVVAPLLLLYQ